MSDCTIATANLHAAEADAVTFSVDIAFQCSPGGETFLDVHLKTESTEQVIPFGKTGIVKVDGKGPLLLVDNNPSKTGRALFNAGCTLEIRGITAQPTFSTLENWNFQAKRVSKRLMSDSALYLAGKQTLDALQWDADQIHATRDRLSAQVNAALVSGGLTLDSVLYPETDPQLDRRGTLKRLDEMADAEKWTALLNSNPSLVNDITLWIQVASIEKGRPAYSASLVKQLLSILKEDVVEAETILERGNQWRTSFDGDNKALHDKVKGLLAGIPAEAQP